MKAKVQSLIMGSPEFSPPGKQKRAAPVPATACIRYLFSSAPVTTGSTANEVNGHPRPMGNSGKSHGVKKMHSREKGSILEGRRVPVAIFVLCAALLLAIAAPVSAVPTPLDPTIIPKWKNEISGPPPVYVGTHDTGSPYD
ncbi:MAG: hypothetical protein LUQ67_03190, partial [Methanomicrobiales archaeon]|nr:hypothetical protein [Methanomicrobiales archaeon]